MLRVLQSKHLKHSGAILPQKRAHSTNETESSKQDGDSMTQLLNAYTRLTQRTKAMRFASRARKVLMRRSKSMPSGVNAQKLSNLLQKRGAGPLPTILTLPQDQFPAPSTQMVKDHDPVPTLKKVTTVPHPSSLDAMHNASVTQAPSASKMQGKSKKKLQSRSSSHTVNMHVKATTSSQQVMVNSQAYVGEQQVSQFSAPAPLQTRTMDDAKHTSKNVYQQSVRAIFLGSWHEARLTGVMQEVVFMSKQAEVAVALESEYIAKIEDRWNVYDHINDIFRSGNYAEVVRIFESLPTSERVADVSTLDYIMTSYFYQNAPESALKIFRSILAAPEVAALNSYHFGTAMRCLLACPFSEDGKFQQILELQETMRRLNIPASSEVLVALFKVFRERPSMDEKRLAIKYFMELTQQCKPGPGVCREAMDLSLSLAKHDPTMVQVCKDILRIVWDHTSPELYLRVTEQFVRETGATLESILRTLGDLKVHYPPPTVLCSIATAYFSVHKTPATVREAFNRLRLLQPQWNSDLLNLFAKLLEETGNFAEMKILGSMVISDKHKLAPEAYNSLLRVGTKTKDVAFLVAVLDKMRHTNVDLDLEGFSLIQGYCLADSDDVEVNLGRAILVTEQCLVHCTALGTEGGPAQRRRLDLLFEPLLRASSSGSELRSAVLLLAKAHNVDASLPRLQQAM